MQIRQAKAEDATDFVALFQRLRLETTFMLLEPGEPSASAEQQAAAFENATKTGSGVTYVCEEEGRIIGFVSGRRGVGRRQSHSLYLWMGILQAWVGRGYGQSLLEGIERWARSNGIHRLELIVNQDNERGIRLYRKYGFEREGVKRHAVKINGAYVDAFYMAKLIEG